MKDLIIWQTYHDDAQIEQYHLHETDTIRIFKGNNLSVEGENINHLNKFYSELVTLYWVWKNNVRSKMVGFCHYRRTFGRTLDLENNSCQVLAISHLNVMQHYKSAHNYQDLYDAVEFLTGSMVRIINIPNTCLKVTSSYLSAVSLCIGRTLRDYVVLFSLSCLLSMTCIISICVHKTIWKRHTRISVMIMWIINVGQCRFLVRGLSVAGYSVK